MDPLFPYPLPLILHSAFCTLHSLPFSLIPNSAFCILFVPTTVSIYCLSNLQYLTGGARKSFVCDDSRNIVYAKHNIICRKATSFSDRKRKRYLRLWRKMVFLPAVGNTTLRVVVPLPPIREGSRIPSLRRVILSLPKFYDNEIPPHTSAPYGFDFAQNDPLS